MITKYCLRSSAQEVCIPDEPARRFEELNGLLQQASAEDAIAILDEVETMFEKQAFLCRKVTLRDLQPRFLRHRFFERYSLFAATRAGLANTKMPVPEAFAEPALIAKLGALESLSANIVLGYVDIYVLFIRYCQTKYCQENPRVLMALQIMEEHMRSDRENDAEEMAWLIFENYVSPGAPNAVTLSAAGIQRFVSGIPAPSAGMWEEIEIQAKKGMTEHLRDFTKWGPWVEYVSATVGNRSCGGKVSCGGDVGRRGSKADAVQKKRLQYALGDNDPQSLINSTSP
jgi:hypothetical protein